MQDTSTEMEAKGLKMKEVLMVCGDRNLGVGLTVWDIETGDRFLHIPTCASPRFGVTCLKNQYLVASQIHRPGCVAGGVIFTWSLNKTQAPLRSYTGEVLGPLCGTKDGIYIAGGAPSGNIYIWEVTTGKLLKTWHGHNISLTCLVFSDDGSLLISGSEDGMVVVWSMISLLDSMDNESCSSVLSCLTAHTSSVTGLLTSSCGLNSVFVSSSLDGTCKAWDIFSGTLLQTRTYTIPITASVLDPEERYLISGSADGRIFVNTFEVGLLEDPYHNSDDQQIVLKGHRESITAMSFCGMGLISASEDCTACLWDVVNWVIIRTFEHQKGAISNLLVMPQSSLVPLKSHQRASNSLRFSLLEKYPQTSPASNGMATLLPSREHETMEEYCSTDLLNQHISDLEGDHTAEAMQMKVDTNMGNRAWIVTMTKHTMKMNKQLQIRLLDIAEHRLKELEEAESPTEERKKKKIKENGFSIEGEGVTQSHG
ncbi:Protein ROOT INITIATION DEFECTIVE like [Heracleum sosnowskyi]|uniref:Protein ROOT INITIATION DEFECTIVE like n=1 Tax=Heracleum sosnowskyi TaxID=360622 RepID=A0AAD8H1F8_9APIA|nr:Protein ROOT INITIATION DEFECTIVE like [Heracleum sosnowskyi]